MNKEEHRIIDIREVLNEAYQYGLEAKGVHDAELANAALNGLTIKATRVIDAYYDGYVRHSKEVSDLVGKTIFPGKPTQLKADTEVNELVNASSEIKTYPVKSAQPAKETT